MTGNMTTGKPLKHIFLFSLPMMLGNLFQIFYNMADTFMVGRLVSVNALAAVGVTGSVSGLIVGFSLGLTHGFTIPIAHCFGAGEFEQVKKYSGNAISLSFIIGLIMTVLSLFCAEPLLKLINTPENIFSLAKEYLVIIFASIIFSMLYNILSGVLRAVGNSKTPLIFLTISGALNVLLNYIFISIFNMGVSGAAFSTLISQAISVVCCSTYIYKKGGVIKPNKSDFILTKACICKMMSNGIPMALQASITNIGNMILQGAVNSFGSDAVAAFTAASKAEQLANLPLSNIGSSLSTFCGQNYGAKKLNRVKQGLNSSLIMSLGLSIVCTFILILFGRPITSIFISQEHTIILDIAQKYLTTIAVCYSALAFLFIFRSTLQGMGIGYVSVVAGTSELVGRALVAYVFSVKFGFTAICLAGPIAWVAADIPLIIIYYIKMRKYKQRNLLI